MYKIGETVTKEHFYNFFKDEGVRIEDSGEVLMIFDAYYETDIYLNFVSKEYEDFGRGSYGAALLKRGLIEFKKKKPGAKEVYLIQNMYGQYVLTNHPIHILKDPKFNVDIISKIDKLQDLDSVRIPTIYTFTDRGLKFYVPSNENVKIYSIYVENKRGFDLLYDWKRDEFLFETSEDESLETLEENS